MIKSIEQRSTLSNNSVSNSRLCHLVARVLTCLLQDEGLERDGTDIQQIPSYVTKLPLGTEKGQYLAIDLGGTNLRVLSIDLHGDSTHTLLQSKIAIPTPLMVANTYKDLFEFIANFTELFMVEHFPEAVQKWRQLLSDGGEVTETAKHQHCHRLGFAFSFAFDQHSINTGTLLCWSKSFYIEDAIGRDPALMLQEALDHLQLPLVVSALANDTVGALVARAYTTPDNSNTLLGAIFGTGTNGAYMEKLTKVKKLHSRPEYSNPQPGELVALNTEWGGFDKELSVLPITSYDVGLDRDSPNPGDEQYEKRVSGLYLGELLRRVLLFEMNMHPDSWSLKIPSDSRLHVPNSIDSSFVSALVQDEGMRLGSAKDEIATTLGASSISEDDTKAMIVLADAIGTRAARLSAIAIAGVVIQSGRLLEVKSTSVVAPLVLSRPWGSWNILFSIARRTMSLLSTFITKCYPRGWVPLRPDPVPSRTTTTRKEYLDEIPVEDIIDIGVDGSSFRYFPCFEKNLRTALREIPGIGLQGEKRIRMGLAIDGSGAGTALIAWSAENA